METRFQYELEVLSTLVKTVQRLQDKIIRCDSTDYIMIDRFAKQCKSEEDVLDRKINELAMNEMWQMSFEDRVKKLKTFVQSIQARELLIIQKENAIEYYKKQQEADLKKFVEENEK